MVSAYESSHPVVAAFDFDHTLTVRDSVVPFVVRVAGVGRVASALLRTLPTVVSLLRRRDNDGLKEHFALHCLAGIDSTALAGAGIAHAQRIVTSRMRQDTCRRLRWHQERGDVVLIVSASFGSYMHVVGDLLEVDAVLCTELEERDGMSSGHLVGANCRGAEKARRTRQWLIEAGMPEDRIVFAYGDSSGDDELLEMASNPVKVSSVDLVAEAPIATDNLDDAFRGRVDT